MPLHCLKITLNDDHLKLLHECMSRIANANIELERNGVELYYGYLPQLPPIKEFLDAAKSDDFFKFLTSHPIFGYYVFCDANDLNNPIGFIAIGQSSSVIEGFVNKSTHFIQSTDSSQNKTGKGYGTEALKMVLKIINPFIGKEVDFPAPEPETAVAEIAPPFAVQKKVFRGISVSVNIKNTPSVIMNARRMRLYDYCERLHRIHSLTSDNVNNGTVEDSKVNSDNVRPKQSRLSHGLYFYYTTLENIPVPPPTPSPAGALIPLTLANAETYLRSILGTEGSKRAEENKKFLDNTMATLKKSAIDKTISYFPQSIFPATASMVSSNRTILETIIEYTGPYIRI